MHCSINDIPLTNGTLSGGFALNQTRWRVNRLFDSFIALATAAPIGLDRVSRGTSIDFQITRIHAGPAEAELYAIDHDQLIPSSGPVKFTTTDGSNRYMLNAALITHERIASPGATTIHNYHIEGGALLSSLGFHILTEDSFAILTETSDLILTE